MKKLMQKRGALLVIGLLMVASLAPTLAVTSKTTEPEDSATLGKISSAEVNNLLATYAMSKVSISTNILVKIYDPDDQLILETSISRSDFDNDIRLQSLIDQSYYLTEVDDTRLYMLKK